MRKGYKMWVSFFIIYVSYSSFITFVKLLRFYSKKDNSWTLLSCLFFCSWQFFYSHLHHLDVALNLCNVILCFTFPTLSKIRMIILFCGFSNCYQSPYQFPCSLVLSARYLVSSQISYVNISLRLKLRFW